MNTPTQHLFVLHIQECPPWSDKHITITLNGPSLPDTHHSSVLAPDPLFAAVYMGISKPIINQLCRIYFFFPAPVSAKCLLLTGYAVCVCEINECVSVCMYTHTHTLSLSHANNNADAQVCALSAARPARRLSIFIIVCKRSNTA